MDVTRRGFLGLTAIAAAGSRPALARSGDSEADQAERPLHPDAQVACLVDTTRCIGCRKCEEACNRANRLPRPEKPFTDQWVLRQERRPSKDAFTVVNSYAGSPSKVQKERDATFVKTQCMHCLDPSCVSACIVAALRKTEEGPVIYDADRCIGCRYCMVACPFEIPAYDYQDPITPEVRKCTFCVDYTKNTVANPSCAKACPMETIIFGRRSALLDLARKRITERPDRYIDHVYGEREVGGTSWLYIVGRPADQVGLPKMTDVAPPRLTEAIQHGIFRYGAAPMAIYAGLAGIMWLTNRDKGSEDDEEPPKAGPGTARTSATSSTADPRGEA